ncbi:hypothetical protein [Gordonia sp. FQ]|uniref:hypothetical protein n=1 Tax=Gordonia sp. FQ TaxID=3446634 RepID=UPI003F87E0D2
MSATPVPALWIDYLGYAGHLLGEAPPWASVDALVAWQRTATGLVSADLIPVDVAAVAESWTAAHPDLVAEMGAKRRATAPLRTLLGDPGLRAHLADVVSSLGAALGQEIVVLAPAPGDLAALAHRVAHGDPVPEFDEDDIDSAAVYLTDFLRVLADTRVDALAIRAPESGAPVTADLIDLYGPLIKVAAHYRWPIGLETADPPGDVPEALAPSFWLRATEWESGAPAGDDHVRLVVIPPGTRPEHALARLVELRAGAATS